MIAQLSNKQKDLNTQARTPGLYMYCLSSIYYTTTTVIPLSYLFEKHELSFKIKNSSGVLAGLLVIIPIFSQALKRNYVPHAIGVKYG